MPNWDCWIDDETSSNTGFRVLFTGVSQPNPRPWPQPEVIGSEHQMLPGLAAQGLRIAQRFGSQRLLRVNLPAATPAIRAGVEALFYRYAAGKMPQVTFYNASNIFLADWNGSPQITPTPLLPERYQIQFELIIESTVS